MAFEFVARNGIIAQNNSTVTGSFLVSGSTTQIGNNTLLGNTTLSGSITISGSNTTPATPTIKIYGDAETNGVIKFLPVTKSIDNSVSASYIFVSGSTNDLYFSQNGNGYANTTRLRWLEGNLYTGLLNGGLITSQSSTVYQISSGSGIIVTLNASITNNPYPTVEYVNWSNLSASIAPTSASFDQTFIGVQSGGTIYAQGTPFVAGQFDTLIPIGIVLHQNHSTINGLKTQPSLAYGFKQRSNIFTRAFGPLKLSGFTVAPSGSSTGSLVIGSGTAYQDGANYPIDPNNPSYVTDAGTSVSKIFRYYQSGSQWVYNTNNGAGYPTIDPVNYSNNGTLATVGASNYSIQRVYWYPNSTTKAIVVYYGNAIYGTLSDAVSNLNVESFSEAPNTAANAVYLGAYAIKGGTNTTLQNTNHFTWLAGGLFRGVSGAGGGGSTVTTTLFGLSDVLLSGPLDHQPLAYDTTAGKWTNQSNISASISGNALTATTASYALTASFVIGLSNGTASYATTALTASNSNTASYWSGSIINAATASYVVTAQTASYTLQAVSASFATLAQTSNTASYVIQAQSASYWSGSVINATTASYALTASYVSGSSSVSASYAATSSYADNFTVGNTLTAQRIVVQTISSSIEYASGSNIFGSLLSNTHSFTGSVGITGSLLVNGTTTIKSASLDYQQNLAVTTGSFQTIVSAATGSFRAAFFDYVTYSGSIVRAGTLVSTWSGSNTEYFENYTGDLGGSTAVVTLQTAISASNIILQAGISGSAWSVRSLVRLL